MIICLIWYTFQKLVLEYFSINIAGKVIAATAIDLMEKPDVLQAAKDEFNKKMKRYGGYTCPVPQGAVPVIPGEKM